MMICHHRLLLETHRSRAPDVVARLPEGRFALLLIPVLLGALFSVGCGNTGQVGDSEAGGSAAEAWADAATLPNDDLNAWVDTGYHFVNANPAYEEDGGPTVCVDEAHFNFHTAGGIFKPFATLLHGDGYRVTRFRSRFAREALSDCQILVIANAQAKANTIGFGAPDSNKAYPHASALTRAEIDEVILWIRGGGALLLIADHAPWPAAVSDLALLMGVHMLDGYAWASAEEVGHGESIVFGTVSEEEWREANLLLTELTDVDFNARYMPVLANPGILAPHPVVEGRNATERIEWVVTFTGQAFLASDDWEPVMVMGPTAVSVAPLSFNFQDVEWGLGPVFSVDGWLHAATRRLGQGRVVILGEGAMCTAQFDDLDGEIDEPLQPYGINAPQAPQNAQFCLNVMHWLSSLLDA